ncbi:MAG: hypothetical protein RIR73_389, partial [Chloroflexota bacterium]
MTDLLYLRKPYPNQRRHQTDEPKALNDLGFAPA